MKIYSKTQNNIGSTSDGDDIEADVAVEADGGSADDGHLTERSEPSHSILLWVWYLGVQSGKVYTKYTKVSLWSFIEKASKVFSLATTYHLLLLV